MSVFEEQNNEQMTQEQKDYLAELVGEDKKFKTVEELARGKYEADQFIEQLKQEQEQLRKDLNARVTVEEAMKSLQNKENTSEASTDDTSQDRQGGDIDVGKLVEEKMSEFQKNERAKNNLAEADRLMRERFGDSAREQMQKIADDKGVSLEFVKATAEQSPKAFASLMGIDGRSSGTPGVTTGDVNTESFGRKDVKTELQELNELRKTNPTQFWKPKVQQRIMELHARGGN